MKTRWFELVFGDEAKRRQQEIEHDTEYGPSHFFRWPWVWIADIFKHRRTTWQ
jgi:hypothetical protein